jgi:hypothetical protein
MIKIKEQIVKYKLMPLSQENKFKYQIFQYKRKVIVFLTNFSKNSMSYSKWIIPEIASHILKSLIYDYDRKNILWLVSIDKKNINENPSKTKDKSGIYLLKMGLQKGYYKKPRFIYLDHSFKNVIKIIDKAEFIKSIDGKNRQQSKKMNYEDYIISFIEITPTEELLNIEKTDTEQINEIIDEIPEKIKQSTFFDISKTFHRYGYYTFSNLKIKSGNGSNNIDLLAICKNQILLCSIIYEDNEVDLKDNYTEEKREEFMEKNSYMIPEISNLTELKSKIKKYIIGHKPSDLYIDIKMMVIYTRNDYCFKIETKTQDDKSLFRIMISPNNIKNLEEVLEEKGEVNSPSPELHSIIVRMEDHFNNG